MIKQLLMVLFVQMCFAVPGWASPVYTPYGTNHRMGVDKDLARFNNDQPIETIPELQSAVTKAGKPWAINRVGVLLANDAELRTDFRTWSTQSGKSITQLKIEVGELLYQTLTQGAVYESYRKDGETDRVVTGGSSRVVDVQYVGGPYAVWATSLVICEGTRILDIAVIEKCGNLTLHKIVPKEKIVITTQTIMKIVTVAMLEIEDIETVEFKFRGEESGANQQEKVMPRQSVSVPSIVDVSQVNAQQQEMAQHQAQAMSQSMLQLQQQFQAMMAGRGPMAFTITGGRFEFAHAGSVTGAGAVTGGGGGAAAVSVGGSWGIAGQYTGPTVHVEVP